MCKYCQIDGCDCKERMECKDVGKFGHKMCGIKPCGCPKFGCDCSTKSNTTGGEGG